MVGSRKASQRKGRVLKNEEEFARPTRWGQHFKE